MEAEQTAFLISKNISATNCDLKYTWHSNPTATVQAVFQGRGGSTNGFTDSATVEDSNVGIILDLTSFYYESGINNY